MPFFLPPSLPPQHLDDLAESFLMSVFHNGRLRTMKANYAVREGDLRVVRPFVYVRERQLREFAEAQGLPVIPENCPACFESPKERHRTKQLLAQQGRAMMEPPSCSCMEHGRVGYEVGRKISLGVGVFLMFRFSFDLVETSTYILPREGSNFQFWCFVL